MINKWFFILKAFVLVNSAFSMELKKPSRYRAKGGCVKLGKVNIECSFVRENNSDKSEEHSTVFFDRKNSSLIVKISEKVCGSEVEKIKTNACSYFEKNVSRVQNICSGELKGEKVKFIVLFTASKEKNRINYRLAQNQDIYFQSGNGSLIRGFSHIGPCVNNYYSAQLPRKFVIATFGVWRKLCSCEFWDVIDKFKKVDEAAKELVNRARNGDGENENRTAIVLSIWEDER